VCGYDAAMLGARARAVLVLAGITGCLPAFAPPIRARDAHSSMRKNSANADCLACHPAESEGVASVHGERRGRAPAVVPLRGREPDMVPRWMVDDPRGCVGCHAVRSVRSP